MHFLIFLVLITLVSCQKTTECISDGNNFELYSDYFVFVADDGGTPLVIPMDMNWNPLSTGYNKEFKSWHGTNQNWPINYIKEDVVAETCEVPQETWQHTSGQDFEFDASARTITTRIFGAPVLELSIPDSTEWIEAPSGSAFRKTYGFKTTAKVDNVTRSGWLVYERIRRDASLGNFGDFEAFFWMPIVVNGVFYHFEQHKGEQVAYRWTDNGSTISMDTLHSFAFSVDSTTADSTSGRTNIPQTMHLVASSWGIDLSLESTGFQAGYGPSFPNGLGYYRQSMLQSTSNSISTGYGMLELILEDD